MFLKKINIDFLKKFIYTKFTKQKKWACYILAWEIYYDFKIFLSVTKLVRKRIHFVFKNKPVTVWIFCFERWCLLFTWEANANYKPSRPWKTRQLKKPPLKFLKICWTKKNITCPVVQDIKRSDLCIFPSVCLPNKWTAGKPQVLFLFSDEFQAFCFSSSCPCNLIVYHT